MLIRTGEGSFTYGRVLRITSLEFQSWTCSAGLATNFNMRETAFIWMPYGYGHISRDGGYIYPRDIFISKFVVWLNIDKRRPLSLFQQVSRCKCCQ
jgi:hypothetical protein